MAGAYRVGSGTVSGVLLVGISTAPDNHPAHGETVCVKKLNAMRKPCGQYPTQGKVGITRMTARTYERWAGGHSACMGRTLRSASRGGLVCIVQVLLSPPHVGMRENRGKRKTLFCVVVFVFLNCGLPLTEPPPEASSSVARKYP